MYKYNKKMFTQSSHKTVPKILKFGCEYTTYFSI